MHVVVIGAGVIGVTTAYALRQHGCEVTVLERGSGVAQGASFANGGVISHGYAGPWAAPGVPMALLRALFQRDTSLRVRPRIDPAFWRWMRRFVSECRLERFRVNRLRVQRLARYSHEQTQALVAQHAIDHERQPGLLVLFRTEQAIARNLPMRSVLADQGIAHRLLSADECRATEGSLNEHTPLAGGLHLPDDETGNCAYFTRRIRELAQQQGVRFLFNAPVTGLAIDSGRVTAAIETQSTHRADAFVLATGADGGALLSASGVAVPLLAVKGCSATVLIDRHELAPLIAIMDEEHKVVVTRMGKRLRIAGTGVLGDDSARVDQRELRALLKVVHDWYPGAARYSQAQLWSGLRAMLPDGPPVLGETPIKNLFVNLGHGASGWALACGSAQVVADIVTGHAPAIDLDGLTLNRFRRPAALQPRPALHAP
jgi:D-amino-acid dehydrogenase